MLNKYIYLAAFSKYILKLEFIHLHFQLADHFSIVLCFNNHTSPRVLAIVSCILIHTGIHIQQTWHIYDKQLRFPAIAEASGWCSINLFFCDGSTLTKGGLVVLLFALRIPPPAPKVRPNSPMHLSR